MRPNVEHTAETETVSLADSTHAIEHNCFHPSSMESAVTDRHHPSVPLFNAISNISSPYALDGGDCVRIVGCYIDQPGSVYTVQRHQIPLSTSLGGSQCVSQLKS